MGYTADSLRYEQKLTQHCKKNYIPIKHLKNSPNNDHNAIFYSFIIIFYQELPNINHCDLPFQTV